MNTIRIFLASSEELEDDRREFELLIGRRNKLWKDKGVFLHLDVWEDFVDAMSRTRLQDEYNEAIRGCDLFVMLFFTKVGRYTEEEFDAAFGQFKATGKPLVYTYFKEAVVSLGDADRDAVRSLWAFQDKLKALGHFPTVYENTAALKHHFDRQLDKLAADGFIAFSPTPDTAEGGAAGNAYRAGLKGDGAIAQGPGATAVGAGSVSVGGDNPGVINAGTRAPRRPKRR